MATVQVRYIVHDVDSAIAFYCQHLGFHEEMHPALPLPYSHEAISVLSSAHRIRRVAAASQCLMGPGPSREAGTASRLKSTISPPPLRRCARREPTFVTISLPALAASKFSSTILPGTPSNCLSRPCLRLA